jgi:NTP pyrophosphatase (non-canonical NTP hydrolase)
VLFRSIDLQLYVAVEELAELIKAVCKFLRHGSLTKTVKDEVAGEIADVQIMCEQLTLMFGIEQEVGIAKMAKLQRLKERIEHG